MTNPTIRIDVRTIAPRERHALIFSALGTLGDGAALELVNDHDPRPLYYQLEAREPGGYGWDYLQQGPDLWRVSITKAGAERAAGTCCGSCGGA